MKEDLNITLVQTSLHWEDRDANLSSLSEKIQSHDEYTDLILLPEMFTTGFSMSAERFAETMDGDAVDWMRRLAKQKNAVICGSLMLRENGRFFNRLIWM